MKNSLKLVLMVAVLVLTVSAVQADSFRISPTIGDGVAPPMLGEQLTFTVYFETTVDMYVSGYNLMVEYDPSEIAYIDPGNIGNFLLPIPGSLMEGRPDFSVPGQVRVWSLLSDGYGLVPAGEVEMFALDFEVIGPTGGDIFIYLLEQLPDDSYGIAAYDWDIGMDKVFKYNGALGAMIIPEPTTMALLGVGLAGVLLRKRS